MGSGDKSLSCRDCGGQFLFTVGEQEFYAQKGFTNEPTRCSLRRRQRKGGAGAWVDPGAVCPHDITGAGQIPSDGVPGSDSRRFDSHFPDSRRRQVHREPYDGPVPAGAVEAVVVRVDPGERFLFVRVADTGADAYVHRSVFAHVGGVIRQGDVVRVTLTTSERGLRASHLDMM